jgi:sulfate permease, SulP family
MTVNHHLDDISFEPLKRDLINYSWENLRHDSYAGITVALLTLPQAMAYSLLAGLPIFCGLFAAIYSAVIAALFGSSKHLVTGPSTAIAILVQSGTAQILFSYFRELSGPERDLMAVQILTQLSMLIAVFQLVAAGCKLGRLTQFVSHSVVVGYIAGTAIAMSISQFFPFLGLQTMQGFNSFYERAIYLFTHLNQIHVPTALIGLSSLLIIIVLKRIDKRIPAAVITLAIAGLTVYIFDLGYSDSSSEITENIQKVSLVGDNGELSDVFPKFAFPFFDTALMNNLLPMAFAIALLSILEATSVAKSTAASSGQRLSINQEIFGLSLGNLLSSFIGAMPISGSPSRTAVSFGSGGQTRFAVVLNALFSILIVFILGFFVTRIPLPAIAALLLVTAANIVNTRQLLLCLKATSSDAFVLWTTLLSCIFFSLDVAFYIGIVLSITLYLKKAALPHLVEYDINESGELRNLDYLKIHEHRTIRVIKIEGELFFGAADLFQTTLKTIAEDDTSTKVIILQLKNARDIDATVCLALQQLYDYLKGSGRHLIACGITPPIWDVLSDSGIVQMLGKQNLFVFDERHPHLYMQKALYRAKALSVVKSEPASNIIEPSTNAQLTPIQEI